MKRLFLAGMLLFLLPLAAEAAPSELCGKLQNLKPVSPYVQKVLDRADAGLKYAKAASPNTNFDQYLPTWALRVGGIGNSLIDSLFSLTVQNEDLLETTACLHTDVLLLNCKIDQVQNELLSQLGKGSILGIVRLESLVSFLQERKTHLIRGALIPSYEDPSWYLDQYFDAKAPVKGDPICPFDSDYAAPASDGYGCDQTVLQKLTDYQPAKDELDALKSVQDQLSAFKDLSSQLQGLQSQIDSAYDEGTAGSSGMIGNPVSGSSGHQTLVNCQSPQTSQSIRTHDLRNPFSFKKSQIDILSTFLEQRYAQGVLREQTDELKNADEFESSSQQAQRRKQLDNNPLLQLTINGARSFFQTVSGAQGKNEAAVFPEATDAQLEVANALGDLRASVGDLSKLAGPKDGLRAFVIRYAYFLRRSCTYRPCSASLEKILRIAFTDECFPYTSGDFTDDTPDSPRWKKCAEKACVALPGVKLPDSCKFIGGINGQQVQDQSAGGN